MKFEHTQVFNFEGALRGMRNPMNSWDKSDSQYCKNCDLDNIDNCPEVQMFYKCVGENNDKYVIGKNDMALAQKLIKAGSEHRKFMRQIFVCVDITAPLYWWKEFDTYKVGTVANSTSTMHKITSQPITIDCFEIDDYSEDFLDPSVYAFSPKDIINFCESLRKEYIKLIEQNDRDTAKICWKELIRWLPESWLQKRTITLNYENLLAMCSKGQRRNHKLNEWSGKDNANVPNFISWARTLPYAQELIFIDELEE